MRGVGMAALLWAIVLPIPRSAAGSCPTDQYVESFDVVARARRQVYRIGETALVQVRVTDSVTGQPQPGIDAAVFIEGRGNHAVGDAAETNERGRARLRLKLARRQTKAGDASALAAAWEPINTPVYCTGRYGYRHYPKLFLIKE